MDIPQSALSPYVEYFVYICIGLSLFLGIMNNRSTSLKVSVFNRWARWLAVSQGAAYLAFEGNWFERPFWVLSVTFFLGWMLLETIYTWFAISALSQSGLALFPRFKENTSGEEWPAQKQLFEVKDWLRGKGFSRSTAVLADLGHGIQVRSSIFQSEDNSIRFQILFVPQSNGDIGYCFSFASETESGERIVTDNLYMPYGGFYPSSWYVLRKPWCRSIVSLYKQHRKRLKNRKLQAFDDDPIDDLNNQQRVLEKTNIEEGFLVPPHLQEEMGRITWEGRYRVWKEVWLLNYFGRPTV
ncbi:hypothetical protein [Pelagicoccus sp. SDUM812003]|uniref:hypothetical protein n=1 Tax=Pelagicoccus sp. SDUM812003 TaxID=3041267 RepID=UPI00280D5324|nr:hypothetical protein [Pelagicoccus sp. SDUM812003]MDQ8204219.1 hypothetical protein [Pelagicoccus sp. SDUM812003]